MTTAIVPVDPPQAADSSPTTSFHPAVRLMSLDALRGFDMMWILGADALVRALDRMGENPITRFLATQLSHVEWAGFHFYFS